MIELENYSPVQYLYDKMVWIGWLRFRDEISMERAEQARQEVLKTALEMEQKRGGLEKPNSQCQCKNAETEKESLVPVFCYTCCAYVYTQSKCSENPNG